MARRRGDDKRRRILQAAVKVFARKGYFAARVAEIARRADVADGTIYLYFKSKEALLVALFDEVIGLGQREGSLRAELPRKLVVKALFGMLDETVTSWILSGKRYELRQLAAPVVDLLLRGAGSAAAAPACAPLARGA